MMVLRVAVLGVLLAVPGGAALAQAECAAYAKTVSERSSAAQKMEEALAKLGQGTPATCKLAAEFAQATAALQTFVEQSRSRCSGAISGMAKTFYDFDLAALPSRLRAADEHVRRCPR